MILLTSLYHDADARRRGELLECLRRNVAEERLGEIHVFIEDAMAADELKARTEVSSVEAVDNSEKTIRRIQQTHRGVIGD